MSEKNGKGRKSGMGREGIGRAKTFKPERKKNSRRWFSPDSLIGKALCVLSVIILTVGAFLAPKLINNLYDAGTLMQISYIDMDMSPYAVPYTAFPDKIMAVAGACTAGMRLAALPAEETAERISDEELIGIVNEGMKTVGESMRVLFEEGWWHEQTADNLIAREKHTVYMRPPAGQEDVPQEMTPFQVWVLTFEMTEKQDELVVYNEKTKRSFSQFTTNRLIVCLDADFYKIIAVAVRGDRQQSVKKYGWDMLRLFGVAPDAPESVRREAASYDDTYERETKTFVADQILQGWANYWGIMPENYVYQIDDAGTLGAYLFLEDGTAGAKEESSGAAAASGAAMDSDADTMAVSVVSRYTDPNGNTVTEVHDKEAEEKVKAAAGYPDEDIPLPGAGELLLVAGSRLEWEETDDNIWILKAGCMDFFEMMQF